VWDKEDIRVAEDSRCVLVGFNLESLPSSFLTEYSAFAEQGFIRISISPRVVRNDVGYLSSFDQVGIFMVNEDYAGAAVFENISDFMRFEPCVNGTQDGTCGQNTKVGIYTRICKALAGCRTSCEPAIRGLGVSGQHMSDNRYKEHTSSEL